ncbi:LacI family DNA-binding transcriptional regulator [Coraliomargarita sp. SDUM461003]|uniref:LacI family DNA-binding transcriptional regulator n=1 Tax=Thalassobacterium maritimum TaxID=3041265 RepID=A0ABU1AT43_9BACT|nr:LacI family DNA-binding transcriptional regulator [Coraliomargarita sp. SDUM461003]MDQ8206315.1 LacI family DNA-binding transcriptional regulator [Coraliomargarita sp. SDUM461003]
MSLSSKPDSNVPRQRTISLRHVAEAAGVSRMTVSRAFKQEASINPAVRKKILKIAKELGYTPDTMVSELMTSFASRRSISYQETFAALWWPERWEKAETGRGFDADIYQGLNEGAQLHGRAIDHLVLTPEMTPRVIMRMLLARNIQGVILTPPPSAGIKAPELEWDQLCTVIVGSSLREPKFHRAQPGHYIAIVQALETLQARGYTRPCLLLRSDLEERMLHAYTAAFLAWGNPKEHIWSTDNPASTGLSHWIKRTKPDVIIADWEDWFQLIKPEDRACGFISLAVRDPQSPISGIYENSIRMAKCAIDLLIRSRLTHELGQPSEPLLLLTSNTWIEGQSLPSRKPESSLS